MTKIFLIGDSEKLVKELSELLKDKCEISDKPASDVQLVFELTNYDREMKFKILNFVNEEMPGAGIVSSSLCITALEQSSETGIRNITGASFYPGFSDAPAVELSRSAFTDPKTFEKAATLLREAGKEVIVSPDRPGLINMRIVSMIINEAFLVLQEGTSNKGDIDTAMKLGTNYPMGPVEWCEKMGADLVYNILLSMHNEFGDDRYRITPLLKEAFLESELCKTSEM